MFLTVSHSFSCFSLFLSVSHWEHVLTDTFLSDRYTPRGKWIVLSFSLILVVDNVSGEFEVKVSRYEIKNTIKIVDYKPAL